jgi:acid stress-induced BolA-like protein IbaG/YrbA
MQPEEIQRLIEAGLKDADVYVEGDGTHFTTVVVSAAFIGKSRLEKQQIVYDTVRTQLMDGSLHALSIKTFTPEEWEQLDNVNESEST